MKNAKLLLTNYASLLSSLAKARYASRVEGHEPRLYTVCFRAGHIAPQNLSYVTTPPLQVFVR